MPAMTVSYQVVPNIGNVVNQGQGFRIKATITNNLPAPLSLNDVSLKVTGVPSNFTPNAEEVKVSTIAPGGNVTVSLGFDTSAGVTTGNHNITCKCEAYIFGHEWTVIMPAPPAIKPIGVKDLYPKVTDTQDVTVTIHPE